MSQSHLLLIDRDLTVRRGDEMAARRSLQVQVTRLERELAQIVAEGFPHISPPPAHHLSGRPSADALSSGAAANGPRLLSLEQLERLRDHLVGTLQDMRRRAQARHDHEPPGRQLGGLEGAPQALAGAARSDPQRTLNRVRVQRPHGHAGVDQGDRQHIREQPFG